MQTLQMYMLFLSILNIKMTGCEPLLIEFLIQCSIFRLRVGFIIFPLRKEMIKRLILNSLDKTFFDEIQNSAIRACMFN